MARVSIAPEAIDRFEDAHQQLLGKRTRDIPTLADFRFKFRWRFRRSAEANFALAVMQTYLAFAPHYPLQFMARYGIVANVITMIFAESRAITLTRQLNRRAAEQLLRDIAGVDE